MLKYSTRKLRRNLLIAIGVICMAVPVLYSVLWLTCSNKIINHFGGNTFSNIAFPKIGDRILITFPKEFMYLKIKAVLVPYCNDSLKINWWDEYKLNQGNPSHTTGRTVHTTVHYTPSLWKKDEHYSGKETTEDIPADLRIKVADNHLLEGKSFKILVYADSSLKVSYNLKVIQPLSKDYHHYCVLKKIFNGSLLFLGSIIIVFIVLISGISDLFPKNKYAYIGAGIPVVVFLLALIITNPGKTKFQAAIDKKNKRSIEWQKRELLEVKNYVLFSTGKVKITNINSSDSSQIMERYMGILGKVQLK